MNAVMEMQNILTGEKNRIIERWEEKFNEAERRSTKLQREKDADRKIMAGMKKDLEDIEDEKAKLEEEISNKLDLTNLTKIEAEKDELQTELNDLRKLKKEELSRLKKEKDKEIKQLKAERDTVTKKKEKLYKDLDAGSE